MNEFTIEELEIELLPTREALNYWHPYGGEHLVAATNVAFAQKVGSGRPARRPSRPRSSRPADRHPPQPAACRKEVNDGCTRAVGDGARDEDRGALPAREALSWINITNVAAVNIAIAVNAASVGAMANAIALQDISLSGLGRIQAQGWGRHPPARGVARAGQPVGPRGGAMSSTAPRLEDGVSSSGSTRAPGTSNPATSSRGRTTRSSTSRGCSTSWRSGSTGNADA